MARIAFATCSELAHGAPDDAPAIAALEARGHEVVQRVWNRDPVEDAHLVVLRSCWDYHLDPAGFRAWLRRLEGRLVNPGWETWRTNLARSGADEAHFRALVSERDVMLQELAAAVLDEGEISLVYFTGNFSHAVVKRPAAGEFRIHAEHGGRTEACVPSPELLAAAERVLAAAPEPLPYARIDLVPSPRGPLLMELEAIDPELFFRFHAGAAERFATALESWLA